MEPNAARPTWKTLLAFFIIYFVWGSTFLAIRVGVQEIPPLVFAAMRFLVAGLVLYGWMLARGEPSPTRRQWFSATLLGLLIFVFDYGLLFWAEMRVPSGIAAVSDEAAAGNSSSPSLATEAATPVPATGSPIVCPRHTVVRCPCETTPSIGPAHGTSNAPPITRLVLPAASAPCPVIARSASSTEGEAIRSTSPLSGR